MGLGADSSLDCGEDHAVGLMIWQGPTKDGYHGISNNEL